MRAISCGRKGGSIPAKSVDKLAMCDMIFHPSLLIKENDQVCLKCSASLTILLCTFSTTNKWHKETQGFSRIVGLKEDSDLVNERDFKIMVNEEMPSYHVEHASIISRDEISIKRVLEIEARKLECES